MIRPPKASALLALVALLGTEAPAAAGGQRTLRPQRTLAAEGAAAATMPAVPVIPSVAPAPGWSVEIAGRLRALASASVGDAELVPDATLGAHLHGLVAGVSSAAVGVVVRDLSSGDDLFRHNADKTLNPASNAKLLTAIAAVELLGRNYRFQTRVLRDGDTLYVVGEGDPSLQLEDVAGLAARTAAALDDDEAAGPIRRIVVDDSFFSDERYAPGYDDGGPGFSYLAPSGALSLQFNTVEIQVTPTEADQPPRVTVSPACEHLRIVNEATTGRGGGLSVETRAEGDQTVVAIDGRISTRSRAVRVRRRVTDPGLYFGTTFADRLAQLRDTEPVPVERGVVPDGTRRVAHHDSAPLSDVLQSALLYSNNFTSEQVLRTLAARHHDAPGDWAHGLATLRAFWSALGLPADELTLENGSGYGRRGRISAEALVTLLSLTARPGSDAAALVESLPAPGEHGTLRRRLGRARGRVRAKTGTLRGASALSGIVSDDDGHRYGFSILVNGRISTDRSRRLQDRVVLALVDHLPG